MEKIYLITGATSDVGFELISTLKSDDVIKQITFARNTVS